MFQQRLPKLRLNKIKNIQKSGADVLEKNKNLPKSPACINQIYKNLQQMYMKKTNYTQRT
jgi:hypothetical protein